MNPNRLSLLFFAVASLIFGGTLAALVVRAGGPAFAGIEREPVSFAGVMAESSSRSTEPASVMVAQVTEVAVPAMPEAAVARAPRCTEKPQALVVQATRAVRTTCRQTRTGESTVVRVRTLRRDALHFVTAAPVPPTDAWAPTATEAIVLTHARISRTALRNALERARAEEAAARARIPST